MSLKFNDYLDLNREGVFPGPEESEEAFIQRIQLLRTEIPLPSPPLSEQEWKCAHQIIETQFDIKPTWVPAFYRNKKLSFWEAAAAWECDGRTVVQLRNRLANGKWWFVSREEVLAHETVHASRMAFHEPRFEEILCYQTSRFSWRKRFGPLFRHPWEATLCIGVAGAGWVFNLFDFLSLALILPWIPFLFFLLRLSHDHHLFKQCLRTLKTILQESDRALAVALRLADKEIVLFARASQEEILSYINEQKKTQLRWKILAAAYFNEFI